MRLTIDTDRAELIGELYPIALQLTLRLEGRKHWPASNILRFEPTEYNIRTVQELAPGGAVDDRRALTEELLRKRPPAKLYNLVKPNWKLEPMPFQLEAFEKFKGMRNFALFGEQGTGKTKIALDLISYKYLTGQIDYVMVAAWPKGVHAQWVEEAIPDHLWANVPYEAEAWDGKHLPVWTKADSLRIFAFNIEAINVQRLREWVTRQVLAALNPLIIIDESQTIANNSSLRTKHMVTLGKASPFASRAIMTGTPLARDLTEEWVQFGYLDPAILGHKYKKTFQAQFCQMGGYEGKSIVGVKNVELFQKLTAPYVHRVTKAEALQLPAKLYDRVSYDLTPEQKKHQKQLRDSYMTELANGEIVSAQQAITFLIRAQQLANGWLKDTEDNIHRLADNPKLSLLKAVMARRSGRKLIWANFHEDVELIAAEYPEAVTYYGPNSVAERKQALEEWKAGMAETLIANPSTMGTGFDLRSVGCETVIYYSNSFNVRSRWQSEDRVHGIGTEVHVTYFDLVGRGSIDVRLMRNLKEKKDMAELVLGDITAIMKELDGG